ncbi:hypothetical protein MKX67_09215 [Cytobacillus sp. FSL W7-1323]|uniref:Uncharacterized protein n=1 Tax=Cytobacillus kochii TaxID=859143 RepID=A0A248TD82_9BACI|nr:MULTISPECIES: hypothetical protein [Cytobacillus]ASV66123.1 hypothetical protein CKF48_01525 [Cytobacillus kochii]MDQ0185010.1 Na+/H+ antiporter NhaC [Cytobacillus kochii]MEA1851777.1 hypothetical protein [Cytobacillus sp. OWB-43]MED1603820.1 hypothetical protein [Cytobacillus kochii]
MSGWLIALIVICLVLIVWSLISTSSILKEKASTNKELDADIPDEVKKRPYLFNPILVVYVVFFVALAAITIFYVFR